MRSKTAEPTKLDETKPQDTLTHSPGPGGSREQEGIRYNGTDGGSEGGRGHGRSEDVWTQLTRMGRERRRTAVSGALARGAGHRPRARTWHL